MPNLQYIGARYVPKFYENPDDGSNNWKAGVTYEALTIVTFAGDSYTSKIPVPGSAGDPASEPTYWIKTAGYNAAITALQNEVSDIENDIGNKTILTENVSLNDALYTVSKLASSGSNLSKNLIYTKNAYDYFRILSNLAAPDETYNSLQGVGYDSTRDRYFIGVTNSNDATQALIAIVDNTFENVILRAFFSSSELGHCNNIIYNPNNDTIAVLCSNTRVAILSATTLSLQSTVTLVYDDSLEINKVTQLTYDADNDLYYGMSQSGVHVFDSAWQHIEYNLFSEPYNDLFGMPANYTHASNGFLYHNEKFYIINEWCSGPSRHNYLILADKNLNLLGTWQLDPMLSRYETEAIIVDTQGLKIFGAFMQFGVFTIDFSAKIGINTIETMLNGGIVADSGLDADIDFYPTGVYTFSKAVSKTIAHLPIYSDMTVVSLPLGGIQTQFIFAFTVGNCSIFKRNYNQTNRVWRGWNFPKACQYLMQGPNMPTSMNNVCFSGFITGAGRMRLLIPNYAFASTIDANNTTGSFTGYATLPDGTLVDHSTPITNLTFGSYGNAIWVQDNDNSYSAFANQAITYHGNFTINIPET